MKLNSEQKMMLEGSQGPTIQKAIRLLIDLGKAANSEKLVPVVSAHVSGVSPLTGGDGLIQFLEDLGSEENELPEAEAETVSNIDATDCFDQARLLAMCKFLRK